MAGDDEEIPTRREAEAGEPAGPQPEASATILVVEDEELVRKLVCRVLNRAGFRVLEACDGREALELARRLPEPIHLLLTDVVMPGLKGPELARHLLQDRPRMQVLYMSGYTDNALAAAPDGDGTLPLLAKPFSPRTVLNRVMEALNPR